MKEYLYLGPWDKSSGKAARERGCATLFLPPAHTRAAIDLRGDCTSNGMGLFLLSQPLRDSSFEQMGEASGTAIEGVRLSADKLKRWREMLGIRAENDWTGTGLLDALWDTLTIHADAEGENGKGRPKPIVPTTGNMVQLNLGRALRAQGFRHALRPHAEAVRRVIQNDHARVWKWELAGKVPEGTTAKVLQGNVRRFRVPADLLVHRGTPTDLREPQTSFTDDFNRADNGSTIGGDWVFTDGTHDGRIVSNKARGQSGWQVKAKIDTDLSASDHYAQCKLGSLVSDALYTLVCARWSSSAATFYSYNAVDGAATAAQYYKYVAGTATHLVYDGGVAGSSGLPTIKLDVNGSSLSGFSDSDAMPPHTDTSITTGLRSGFAFLGVDHSIDDFETDDGLGGGVAIPSAAVVQDSGRTIALTFASSQGSVPTGNYALTSDDADFPIDIDSITGSGTAWSLTPDRLMHEDEILTLTPTGESGITCTGTSDRTEPQARHIWRKFGLFVHWGMWTFNQAENESGEEDPDDWNPTGSIASAVAQWVAMAEAVNMKDVCFTTKHRGGFALWDTATTPFGINESAWFAADPTNRDVVKVVTDQFRAAGIRIGLYYNVEDRYWEAHNSVSVGTRTAFVIAQLTELLENYGDIDFLWFDHWGAAGSGVPGAYSDRADYDDIRAAIHAIQPNCLMLENNHVCGGGADNGQESDLTYTDVVVYEDQVTDIPGSANAVPGEYCSITYVPEDGGPSRPWRFYPWGWYEDYATDPLDVVASATILAERAQVQARNSTYRLNVGPDTSGKIPLDVLTMVYDLEGLTPPSGEVTGISITEGNQTLYGGQTFDFTAVVTGTDDFDDTVTWSVTGGGSINSSGVFTAPGGKHEDAGGEQEITITATANGDDSFTATRTVTVPRHAAEGGGGNVGTVGGILGS